MVGHMCDTYYLLSNASSSRVDHEIMGGGHSHMPSIVHILYHTVRDLVRTSIDLDDLVRRLNPEDTKNITSVD
jgi:hypothetical protein